MADIALYQQKIRECEREIGKGIIGQKEVIRQVMLALLSGGNVLLEGMPGLGKTMLVRTISQVFLLSFKRIQFTPDLMPQYHGKGGRKKRFPLPERPHLRQSGAGR